MATRAYYLRCPASFKRNTLVMEL